MMLQHLLLLKQNDLLLFFFSSFHILLTSACVGLSCMLIISNTPPFQGKGLQGYGILSSAGEEGFGVDVVLLSASVRHWVTGCDME